jgi:hypothetical protein
MTDFARPALRIADTAILQLRGRPQQCQLASKVTIRPMLMATAVVALLALSGPLAHSAGDGAGGVGLPLSAANDPTARAPSSSQSSEGVMLAQNNSPHFNGTNPYVVAIVSLRVPHLDVSTTEREDLVAHIQSLEKRYEFAWDGSVLQDKAPNPAPGSDYTAIRILLHRSDIPALSREASVVKVERISYYPF